MRSSVIGVAVALERVPGVAVGLFESGVMVLLSSIVTGRNFCRLLDTLPFATLSVSRRLLTARFRRRSNGEPSPRCPNALAFFLQINGGDMAALSCRRVSDNAQRILNNNEHASIGLGRSGKFHQRCQ
jgi:hypothetical protein